MDAGIAEIFGEFLRGSFNTALMILVILTPIMVTLEVIKDTHLLEKIAKFTSPLMRLLTLSPEASFPLLAGVVFGISYGSGVILQVAKEGRITKRDLLLLSIFFGACHGMIEDPAIFAAIGAHWPILVFTRVISAFVLVIIIGRLYPLESVVD